MTQSQPKTRRELTRADILPLDKYAKIRRQRRSEISEIKKRRRVEVGPFATFYFENFDTMWQQVQEMLYIEKGGEAQIEDVLERRLLAALAAHPEIVIFQQRQFGFAARQSAGELETGERLAVWMSQRSGGDIGCRFQRDVLGPGDGRSS